jgi:hypothetical protein
MDRRAFLKASSAAVGSLAVAGVSGVSLGQEPKTLGKPLHTFKKPLAIAMWDFSWLLRHYDGGGFENWDAVLSELAARGYNAIRIDCFPQLVAADNDGKIVEEFHYWKKDWRPALWGNDASVCVRPREALAEFLPLCKKYGIYVGLSTWFREDASSRHDMPRDVDGFTRVWTETIDFLAANGLMDNVVYVDLLNEYPLFHGFVWLSKELDKLKGVADESVKDAANLLQSIPKSKTYNLAQKVFYRDFATKTIKSMKARRPGLDYTFCVTESGNAPWTDLDFSEFGLLDSHVWFVHQGLLSDDTGYWGMMGDNDMAYANTYRAIKRNWTEKKGEFVKWMDGRIALAAEYGAKFKIPVGNTEGWGPVGWMDNPNLDWQWVKETAEICATLGAEHGYMFNCTSNFTHPHFRGYWKDVKWHRKVTSIIRKEAV